MAEPVLADPPARALWRGRRFATAWGAQTVSELGDRVSELALPLVAVTVLDESASRVALLTAVVWLPNLLALLVGTWVDRRPRPRMLLVNADLARAVVVLTVPLAAVLGGLTFAHLLAVALLLGAWSTLFRSAWQPFFVALVPRERYVEANGLFSATRSGSFIAGPALGGGLVQLLTAPYALVVDGLSFLASASLLRAADVPDRTPAPDDGSSLRRRLADGMRHVWRDPFLAPLLRCVSWINLFTFVVQALLVVFASRELGLSAGTIGLALGIGAAGGLLGAVVAGRFARRVGIGRTAVVGALLFTLPTVALPFAHGPELAKVAVLTAVEAVTGFGVMLFDVNVNAVMVASIPDAVRARVQGAFTTVNYGVRPLGAALGGLLAGLVGTGPALALGGGLAALAVLWLVGSPVLAVHGLEDVPDPDAAECE
ncbi:MFS transporter [Phycicoccus sonneratiae]|uniref:MFS transporter n=1 Tax=Phycicoccus sonneratiae TaxID=2807628 RepID=A0ABS2CKN8_9MICO|nr:MFS transporter [Phycicoccus sonneraticus]MBM6400446.1 MFS transporter [Phycicoccus sonneraticus]